MRAAPSSRSSPGGRAAARPPASTSSSASGIRNTPNIKFVNAAVAGGAGTNAKAVLAQRLAANDPPDSFQGHAGRRAAGLHQGRPARDARRDSTSRRASAKIMPEQLIDQITVQGPHLLGAGQHPPRERALVQPGGAEGGGHRRAPKTCGVHRRAGEGEGGRQDPARARRAVDGQAPVGDGAARRRSAREATPRCGRRRQLDEPRGHEGARRTTRRSSATRTRTLPR